MGYVRCKFRCLGVEMTWDQVEVVRLSAVYAGKNGKQIEENKVFWDATPSGDLTLRITNPESHHKFESGEYYHLDFYSLGPWPKVEDGGVILVVDVDYVGKYRNGQTTVKMTPAQGTWDDTLKKTIPNPMNSRVWKEWPNMSFEMSINNPTASRQFVPGDSWMLRISKSD